jgi:hypothetical protein
MLSTHLPDMPANTARTHAIRQEFERRILHGLASEWKEALRTLDSSLAEGMRMPSFALADMKKTLGRWSREKREICLSRDFVHNHGWGDIREVLLHEISHQLAHEALGALHDPPHGPQFQRACHLLRANPKASGRYRPLSERILQESSSTQDKILLKVKKLMALAESSNQHEAELAMAKAHQFISRHNVDLLAHEQQRDFVSLFLGAPGLRHFREDYTLSALLQDFYFVYAIWVPAYVLEKGKMGRVLEISGTVQNTTIAAYVHDFVRGFVDVRWSQYNQSRRLNRHRKTDFAIGIIKGFRGKIESQPKNRSTAATHRSLIKIRDPMLIEYAAHRYPYTRSVGRRASTGDAGVLNDGIKLGKELVISKGITRRGGSCGGLLGEE